MIYKIKDEFFALSVIAVLCPIITIIIGLFDKMEPYSLLHFRVDLLSGAIIGSIFGIIAIAGNRKRKKKVITCLSAIPFVLIILNLAVDFLFVKAV
ncbi:MAG: hypothetical protein HDT40_12080 [Lachnospiraceae bacterium]|nr:hypothetical protein [Lachnospiraceae bacterium]